MFAAKNELFTRPSGGYVIPRSLRFRSSASAYLNRTFGTPTDNKKWTYSVWFKRGIMGTALMLYDGGASGDPNNNLYVQIFPATSDFITIVQNTSAATDVAATTTAIFRDPAAWYHLVVVYDSANATATDRVQLWMNGTRLSVTYATGPFAINTASQNNKNGSVNLIGRYATAIQYFDGYFAEVNFIDGQALTPTSFGATNATTGVWAPIKYTGTYGTNGFHLDFNSYATTAALGTDTSGNGNTWTTNNFSVTAGVTYDSMIDVPTVSSTGSNYATYSPIGAPSSGMTVTDGNLKTTPTGASWTAARSGFAIPSGKVYFEFTCTVLNAAGYSAVGIDSLATPIASTVTRLGQSATSWAWLTDARTDNNSSPISSVGTSIVVNDVIMCAVDLPNGMIWWGKNGTWFNSGSPAAGTGTQYSNVSGTVTPAITSYAPNPDTFYLNSGQRAFTYTPPSGYSALNTYNLPTPTILKGNTVMDATLYTGTGASLSVTNAAGFQPDLVWVKSRSAATDHAWYDSVRGVQKQLESNQTGAETTETTGLTAFGSGGFTVGALAQMNTSAATYVGWQWKGSGTTVSNASGTITSTVCVNPTAGFSVLTYTGTGVTATIGHSLGVAPSMVITKNKSAVTSWRIYHAFSNATPQNYALYFDTSAATAESAFMNNTAPTSAVFTAGTNICGSASVFVSYCFAPIAGYSAFGSYTGNGSADGPFVFTGFRPKWVLVKMTSATSYWQVLDTSRSPYNLAAEDLMPNLPDAEVAVGAGYNQIDILSNGFKFRNTNCNSAAGVYIYAAFAESPFKNSLAR